MSTFDNRTGLLAVSAFLLGLFPGVTWASQAATRPTASPAVMDIQFNYKRDPRLVDPTRGLGPWVAGPTYTGATAQDTVEAVINGVDSKGLPVKISPEWSASDAEMVTVSPRQSDDVKITVHKAGESILKVTANGISKELVVHATYSGKFIVFNIASLAQAKPDVPTTTPIDPSLKTEKQQVSYAAGMNLARTLQRQSVDVDEELVEEGFRDAFPGRQPLMTEEQAHIALMGVETKINITEAELQRKAFVEKNRKESDEFLAANKKKDGVVTLPSGLQYKIVKAGDGKRPTALDAAICQYRATLTDGTEFDNSYKSKGGGPVTFPLRSVIKGWQEALTLMPTGSKWELFVPPDLAYGDRGVPRAKIPPNAALIFEVELLSIKGPESAPTTPTTNAEQQPTLTPEQIDALQKILQGEKKP